MRNYETSFMFQDLPPFIKSAIEEELKRFGNKSLAFASEQLSSNYRNATHLYFTSDIQRAAYLAARAPATYASVSAVLKEVKRLSQNTEVKSVLDAGAGAGTASFAVFEMFDEIETLTLIEQDAQMLSIGKRLMNNIFPRAKFVRQNLNDESAFEPHDLVVISYALNEIESKEELLLKAWQACQKLLVIVEPGNKNGFANILKARSLLMEKGANLIAPCPHSSCCPLTENDWCHFSARLSRSQIHRKAKSANLSYEDEKFSYLVFSKTNSSQAIARILRHPLKHKGRVRLTLCTKEGYKVETVSARNKENYKRARKTDWGDEWKNEPQRLYRSDKQED